MMRKSDSAETRPFRADPLGLVVDRRGEPDEAPLESRLGHWGTIWWFRLTPLVPLNAEVPYDDAD
jgi:hypothetical protein